MLDFRDKSQLFKSRRFSLYLKSGYMSKFVFQEKYFDKLSSIVLEDASPVASPESKK